MTENLQHNISNSTLPPLQRMKSKFLLTTTFVLAALTLSAEDARWWKGNLHTHSLWSDGDDYPEMIADWYRSSGYHFLAISDHNVLSEGERWIHREKNAGGLRAFEKYLKRFGNDWVEQRVVEGVPQVRLKTYVCLLYTSPSPRDRG